MIHQRNTESPRFAQNLLHSLGPLCWSTPWGFAVEIVVEPHSSLDSFTLRLNNRSGATWGRRMHSLSSSSSPYDWLLLHISRQVGCTFGGVIGAKGDYSGACPIKTFSPSKFAETGVWCADHRSSAML